MSHDFQDFAHSSDCDACEGLEREIRLEGHCIALIFLLAVSLIGNVYLAVKVIDHRRAQVEAK